MNEFIRHQSKSYPLFGDYVIYIHDHEQLVRGSAKWGLVIDIFSSFVSVTTKSLKEDALISVCLRMWEWNNITGCVWVWQSVGKRKIYRVHFLCLK